MNRFRIRLTDFMHSRVVYVIDQQRAGYANYIISMNNGINGWFVLGILVF